jgi:hypothetical protein
MVIAQGLFLTGSPYVTLSSGSQATPIYLVINAQAYTGITGAGNIISEGEYNYVDWIIGTSFNAGHAYTVPFMDNSSNYIPLSMLIGAAGTGATNYVLFSTYHTSATITPLAHYDNIGDVVDDMNMFGTQSSTGSTSDVNYVVNRWWIIDAESYSTSYGSTTNMPSTITLTLTFPAAELPSDVSCGAGNFKAQPYVDEAGTWKWDPVNDIISSASTSCAGPDNVVTNSFVKTYLFRDWVLVGSASPLPIELLSFTAGCNNSVARINWQTASETNNNYFTIERSKDAQTWVTVTTIPGAGNSNTTLSYSYNDNNPYAGSSYYRLKQTDFNGQSVTFDPVALSCSSETPFNFISLNQSKEDGDIVLQFTASEGEQYSYVLYDIRGRMLQNKSARAVEGINQVHINTQGLSESIYLVTLQNVTKFFSKKIFISNQF